MEFTVQRRIRTYLAAFAALFVLWLASPAILRPRSYSIPSGKVVRYINHKSAYKVVFVGDSRTFTDIQPRVVSPIIGRQSYNMASFGLWMPVQYLEFQDAF